MSSFDRGGRRDRSRDRYDNRKERDDHGGGGNRDRGRDFGGGGRGGRDFGGGGRGRGGGGRGNEDFIVSHIFHRKK